VLRACELPEAVAPCTAAGVLWQYMSCHVPGVSSLKGTPYRSGPQVQAQSQQQQQRGAPGQQGQESEEHSATPAHAATQRTATPPSQSEHGDSGPATARSTATAGSASGREQHAAAAGVAGATTGGAAAGGLEPGALLRLLELPASQESLGALMRRVEAVCSAGALTCSPCLAYRSLAERCGCRAGHAVHRLTTCLCWPGARQAYLLTH
jgi:hypothetical protein